MKPTSKLPVSGSVVTVPLTAMAIRWTSLLTAHCSLLTAHCHARFGCGSPVLERASNLQDLPEKRSLEKSSANTASIESVKDDAFIDILLRQLESGRKLPSHTLLPDVPINQLGDFLLVVRRIRRLRQGLIDMVEDEHLDLGLCLLLLGPLLQRSDQALQLGEQLAALLLDPLALCVAQ
jgi:hypothetical protein